MPPIRRYRVLAVLAAAAIILPGCARLRTHQGYVIDPDLVNAVRPGTDNRQSVLTTLGRPTLTSQFNDGEWYYVSRESRNYAFASPSPKEQTTLRIRFDAQGNVAAVDRFGIDRIVSIDPSGDKTPTLGRKRSFFQDLFGNIGSVGAGGAAGGGDGPGGPGR